MPHVVCNNCKMLTGILIEEKDDESYLICTKCNHWEKIEAGGKGNLLYYPDSTDTDDS